MLQFGHLTLAGIDARGNSAFIVPGVPAACCYLKDAIQGVEPNPYGSWVHTGQFNKPPISELPLPSALQDRFMVGDWSADGSTIGSFTQFMHFSVTTFGNIEHDCVDGKCLPASMFNPTNVDTDQWVQTAKGMGASEICLTGEPMWPWS